MRHIRTFENFLNVDETKPAGQSDVVSKVIKLSFDIDNEAIGHVEDEFTLAMSPDSTGVFKLGKDVEKFCGIPEAEVIRDVKAGKEKPDDALIYGLCNMMNGGKDIFFWTNGTRLGGAAVKVGAWPAVMEQLSHECLHLTRKILTRAIAKKKGIDCTNEDWIKADYGGGEYFWPAVGENNDPANPIVIVDEESCATALGIIVQIVTPHFLKMAATYVPQLAGTDKV